jgi:hypothetical protein
MYTVREIPVRHVLADVPVWLPFDILLALPAYLMAEPVWSNYCAPCKGVHLQRVRIPPGNCRSSR